MTRPGDRLRRLAARFFSPDVMDHLIDPVVADLQAEYSLAVRHGRTWRRRRVLIAGYVAFVKVFGLCGWNRLVASLRGHSEDDHETWSRSIGCSVAAIAVVTILMELPWLLRSPLALSARNWRLMAFLMPQALSVAVPVGLALGLVIGLGGRVVSRRLTAAVLGMAIVWSIGLFGNAGWVVPAANQAFRVSASGYSHLRPGPNELTFGELSQQIRAPGGDVYRARTLAFVFHLRVALSCAALVLAIFVLSIATRRSVQPWMLWTTVCGAFVGYYGLVPPAQALALAGDLPAAAAAWLPNAVLLAISAALLTTPSQEHVRAAGADTEA